MTWLLPKPKIRTGEVLSLARQGVLGDAAALRALQVAQRSPTAQAWPQSLATLMAAASGVLLVVGVICIVAYNWQVMGRWARFGLAQLVILAVFAAALWAGLGSRLGKGLLTGAIGLIGPLLALFGQTYQTGADTYELFKLWAILATPWVLASRFAGAWLLWLAIIETAVVFYITAFNLFSVLFFGFVPPWLGACLFNAAALLVWEWAAYHCEWLQGRLGPRVIALVLVGLLTAMTVAVIFGVRDQGFEWGALLWLITVAAGYYAYRVRSIELGMLALGWLSLTTVVMAALIRVVIAVRAELVGMLVCTMVLIAAGTWGRTWFQAVMREAREQADAANLPTDLTEQGQS